MQQINEVPDLVKVGSWAEERTVLVKHIQEMADEGGELEILEAGCGTRWGLQLEGTPYRLTGVDLDAEALDVRQNQLHDLDEVILGDLRNVELESGAYDLVFNSNVLEHIDGAETVLENLVDWTRPGGRIILVMPNGGSAKAFFTQATPYAFHVFFMKHVRGVRNAGQPGYGPYRTYFDAVVSLEGVKGFCRERGLGLHAVYSSGHGRKGKRVFKVLSSILTWSLHLLTLGRLTARHPDLIFIIDKPVSVSEAS